MENKVTLVKESMKRGFTLVELLVVVAILGILGTIAVSNVTEHLRKANETAAKASVDSIKDAVITYSIANNSKLPDSLDKLVEERGDNPPILEGGSDVLIDPWGNKYNYEKKGNKHFVIISAGPDSDFGTEDDIRSDKINKKKQ